MRYQPDSAGTATDSGLWYGPCVGEIAATAGGSVGLVLSAVAASLSTLAAVAAGYAVWSNSGARVEALERNINNATVALIARVSATEARMEQEHQVYVSLSERADEQLARSESARKRAQQERWRAEQASGVDEAEAVEQQLANMTPQQRRDQAKREVAASLRAVG